MGEDKRVLERLLSQKVTGLRTTHKSFVIILYLNQKLYYAFVLSCLKLTKQAMIY